MSERAIERSGEREGEAPQALAWEWVYAGRVNGQLARRPSVESASVTIVAIRCNVQKTIHADKLGVNLTRCRLRGRYTGQGQVLLHGGGSAGSPAPCQTFHLAPHHCLIKRTDSGVRIPGVALTWQMT